VTRAEPKPLSASLEDYLEAIYQLAREQKVARVRDIAARLNVNMSSVTGALKTLVAKGLINHDPYQFITLTAEGEQVARELSRRHEVLIDFLVKVLGIDANAAHDNACRMEHTVDQDVLERLVDFIDFVETCPRSGADWVKKFCSYCEGGSDRTKCERCMKEALELVSDNAGKNSKNRHVSLRDLKPGEKGRIVKIEGSGLIKKRIFEMGVVPGTVVELERVAPLGDPIEIKVRGYHLSLRKAEAAGISILKE